MLRADRVRPPKGTLIQIDREPGPRRRRPSGAQAPGGLVIALQAGQIGLLDTTARIDHQVEFVQITPGRYEFVAATGDVSALKGMFGPARKPVTVEAMNGAIAKRGAAAR